MKFHFCSVFFTFHPEVISEELKPQKISITQKKVNFFKKHDSKEDLKRGNI